MPKVFIHVINMSFAASALIIAMLLLRIVLRRAPKWITLLLWGMVALRLMCPFSIESVFSLIPSGQVMSPDIMMDHTPNFELGISFLNLVINEAVSPHLTPNLGDSMNPLQLWIPVVSVIWIMGMLGMLVYAAVSYVRVKRSVATAVRYENNLYQSENVASPFVFGIIKPKIYLPFSVSEEDMAYVIAHEKAHIHGRDYLWKPLGFLLLTLHWFNPFVWLAYVLFCRDMEIACDERAIRFLDRDERANYSAALLRCSTTHKINACPLAFGEVGVKKRIQAVLKYKRPALWLTIAAIVLCVCLAVGFLTNPIPEQNSGVSALWVSSVDADTINLNLGYRIPTGRYSVRYVPENEWENTANGKVEYDGSLGKYRVYISFGDTLMSDEMREKFSYGEAVELTGTPVPMRVKAVCPDVHGVGLYIGFDTPIEVVQAGGTLNTLGGWITIPITLLPTE